MEKRLPLAPQEVIDYCFGEADRWLKECYSAWQFGDVKRVSRLAIAEYLAYTKGYTLYKNCASDQEA